MPMRNVESLHNKTLKFIEHLVTASMLYHVACNDVVKLRQRKVVETPEIVQITLDAVN